MGCDIHAHVEIKINNTWHHYNKIGLQRNYELFGKMAGVRGDAKPIAEPRGLPPDLSVVTKMEADRYGIDGHTHSWLTIGEMARVQTWLEDQNAPSHRHAIWVEWGFLCGNLYRDFITHRDDFPAEIEDVRLVFWFDN